MSAMTLPISLKSTWATKTVSPSADGIGESQVTTLVPASWASTATGAIWSPALLESMTTSKPWVGALVTCSIWPATLLSAVGPVKVGAVASAELGRGFLCALVGLVEHEDAQELGQQEHVHVLAGLGRHEMAVCHDRRAASGRDGQGQCRRDSECPAHELLLL